MSARAPRDLFLSCGVCCARPAHPLLRETETATIMRFFQTVTLFRSSAILFHSDGPLREERVDQTTPALRQKGQCSSTEIAGLACVFISRTEPYVQAVQVIRKKSAP